MPGISSLLDSDTEADPQFVDENSLISSVSEDTLANLAPTQAKKPARKRKPVTMPKKPRVKPAAKSETKATTSKTAAKRKAVEVDAKEDDDENDLVETEAAKPKGKTTKTTKAKDATNATTKPTKSTVTKKSATQEAAGSEDALPSPVNIRSNFAFTKPAVPAPKPVAASKTQTTAQRPVKAASRPVEEVVSEDEEDEMLEQQYPRKKMRLESKVRQEPSYRRRAGSASDTERGDPMLRRKLGDVTRKFENVDLKYRNLKDVAVSEANNNVDKLRKQCEAITEASDKLVSSLKKQLAQQAPLLQESRKLKKDAQAQAQAQETEATKLRTANNDLSAELASSKSEIKQLQAKLAAARATPAPVEVKQPASSVKSIIPTRAPIPPSSQHSKEAQLKIDLYSDLTGLIVQSVKQDEAGDTYDCIQTGRNGSKFFPSRSRSCTNKIVALHFKLFVDQENAKKVSFEETEFLYSPQLDANRDRDLIEMMPDYLTEDITFIREVAAKFYTRVVKTLTEKPIEEEV